LGKFGGRSMEELGGNFEAYLDSLSRRWKKSSS
jgi:hypothetical protein